MKKILSLLFIVSLLTACGEKSADNHLTVLADSLDVRIAITPTIDCLPLCLASDHGMFQRAGIQVALTTFTAQMDCDTAFVGGSVAAMATDLVRLERLRRQQVPFEMLTATDAEWILYTSRNSRIRQLRQLDDHTLAMTRYSATDMLAELMMDSVKLAEDRVFRIQINDVTIRQNMMQNSLVDGALMMEPQATAVHNFKAHLMFNVSERFNLKLGAIAARQGSLSEKQKQAFAKAYNEACDSLNERGLQAYQDVVINRLMVTSPATLDSLMAKKFVFTHVAQPRQTDLERVKDWFNKKMEKENVEKQPIQ